MSKQKTKKGIVVATALLLATAIGTTVFLNVNSQAAESPPENERQYTVTRDTITVGIEAEGKLEARKVHADVADGIVLGKLLVQEGQQIKKGDRMAELSVPEAEKNEKHYPKVYEEVEKALEEAQEDREDYLLSLNWLLEKQKKESYNLYQERYWDLKNEIWELKVLSTSLGIVVGAITIVLVIAIGQGGEEKAAQNYSGLSADTLYINLNYEKMGADPAQTPKLTPELIQNILQDNRFLTGMYLRNTLYQEVAVGREKEYVSLAGVTAGYSEVSALDFSAGADFSEEDLEEGKQVVVLGSRIAKKYFGNESAAVDKRMKIGDKKYKVIGVLSRSEEGLQGLSFDDSVIMPYETMIKNKLVEDYQIPRAVGKAVGVDKVRDAIRGIESTLNYYLTDGSVYLVEDAATESARTMKMILISVAAIVFVVGGIGITNVLFVTIRERTGEIGVLKALGNSNGAILLQFLLESVSIGVFSGIVGILISMAKMPDLEDEISKTPAGGGSGETGKTMPAAEMAPAQEGGGNMEQPKLELEYTGEEKDYTVPAGASIIGATRQTETIQSIQKGSVLLLNLDENGVAVSITVCE